MKWSNVLLILQRELRDQLRDRRTMFTIVVLPLLLYPLLAMGFLQVAQFSRKHQSRVWVVGASQLPTSLSLLEGDRFHRDYVSQEESQLLEIAIGPVQPNDAASEKAELDGVMRQMVHEGEYDAALFFPSNFAQQLLDFFNAPPLERKHEPDAEAAPPIPLPALYVNTADDKSRIARDRILQALAKWKETLVRRYLKQRHIPAAATQPFQLAEVDVAEETKRRAAVWSKVLPFVVLVWALTGAFYPAIDLCAGEKERGTLETLLSSPAQRLEIVLGKLFTVMTFSMATALLNLISMAGAGAFIISQMERWGGVSGSFHIGPPPAAALFWLILILPPVSALFSALSLAIAAFARSSKEGQYYLMPLLMITLPLMLIPLLPAAQLDLGTSLIPLAGLMLLLRTLIEGQHLEALRYAAPVVFVTAIGCLLAIRWAVDQFRNESVLFRESERWRLGLWIKHLVRDRGETPRVGEAVFCGMFLLLIRFFAGMIAGQPDSWWTFAATTLTTLIALIAAPALLMTIVLTRNPRKTLLLVPAPRWSLLLAGLLALLLHPAGVCLAETIKTLYPLSDDIASQLGEIGVLLESAPSFWLLLPVMALAPAVCEELAFRGFILSGLRRMGHKWAAIVLSSVFFGAAHGILQQSLHACVIGVVVGFIAVQTRCLFPCIVFHAVYNSLSLWLGLQAPDAIAQNTAWQWVFLQRGESYVYHWPWVVFGSFVGVALLYWFRRLPDWETEEESLCKALDHQAPQAI